MQSVGHTAHRGHAVRPDGSGRDRGDAPSEHRLGASECHSRLPMSVSQLLAIEFDTGYDIEVRVRVDAAVQGGGVVRQREQRAGRAVPAVRVPAAARVRARGRRGAAPRGRAAAPRPRLARALPPATRALRRLLRRILTTIHISYQKIFSITRQSLQFCY